MKKYIKYMYPLIGTLVIISIIYMLNGLYPFGSHSIVQVDADYQYIPVLYRIYDFLHFKEGIIYDDIGFGNNIYTSLMIQGSLFSPINLMLYFVKRDNIVNYFNIILMVKICLISLSSYIYIDRKFKVSNFYKVLFSILYGFSGWVLLNYFNIMWLDSVILFPLIIMYLEELIKNDKCMGYIIFLSGSLIITYYISFYILIFIIFYSFLLIFLFVDKKRVKKVIFNLGKSTVIAILISSFSILPTLYQTFISERFTNVGSNQIFYNFINKSLYLMLSSVFLIYFISYMFKYRSDKKRVYFYLVLFILYVIGIFIEPINLAMHAGSYWSFPYRYSFITIFILMNGSLFYIEKFIRDREDRYGVYKLIIVILLGIVSLMLDYFWYKEIQDGMIILDFENRELYFKIVIIFIILCLMSVVSLSFGKRNNRYFSLLFTSIISIFVYSSFSMYYGEGYFLTREANEINSNIGIVRDDIYRYKMDYGVYTPDYGFMYRVRTLDNWLHIIPKGLNEIYGRLGYKNNNTCIRSYGGTLFSDWLFNVKYIISDKILDNDLYDLIGKYRGNYLYQYKYDIGYGVLFNNDSNMGVDGYNFDLQNEIYKKLFETNDNIIKIDSYSYVVSDNIIKIDYKIEEKGNLYLKVDNSNDIIKVNGEEIMVYEDGGYIVDLGVYSSSVMIEISTFDGRPLDVQLGFIKLKDIMNLEKGNISVSRVRNGYDVVVNDNLMNYIFIPINNVRGLEVMVNNKEAQKVDFVDNFLVLKINKGDNNIEIRYHMPLFRVGIILSLIGIGLFLINNKITGGEFIYRISYYCYLFLVCLVFIYMYVYALYKYMN